MGRLPAQEDDEVALRRVGGEPLLDQGEQGEKSQYILFLVWMKKSVLKSKMNMGCHNEEIGGI